MHHISDAAGASARAPAGDPRPPRTTVIVPSIPEKIRDATQWVVWRYERDPKSTKWTKVPYQALGGRKVGASSTDSTTWTTFLDAYRYYQANEWIDGIGFVVSKGDPWGVGDLDHCRDPETGVIEPWALRIVAELPTYWEVSPSGAGLRAVALGTLPPKGRKHGNVEMYDAGRFVTITGHRLPGARETIEECTAGFARVHAEHIVEARAAAKAAKSADRVAAQQEQQADEDTGPEPAHARMNGHAGGAFDQTLEFAVVSDGKALSDEDVIRVARNAKNGDKFARLWSGDTSDYRTKDNDGRSEADAGLLEVLAFYCRGDREQMARIFSRSGLYREKWDRADYRERTIDLALDGKTKFFGDDRAATDGANGHAAGFRVVSASVSASDDEGSDQEEEDSNRVSAFPRKQFPTECLPLIPRLYVEAAARATGAPTGFVALPLMVFAGTALGNEHRIELKSGFSQRATLYGGVVGPPGSVKSPAIDHARYPLDALQADAHERYVSALDGFERDLEDWESLPKDKQRTVSKPIKPSMAHFYTTNATTEALAVMLRDNRGVALVFDELTSWVHGMNAYRGGKGGDRQAYLSQWAGSPLKIDRKGQDTVFVPRPCIGVVGGVQPDLLKDLADEGGRRDGFVERILWEYSACGFPRWTDDTVPETLRAAIVELFGQLRRSTADRPVTLSHTARARYVRWYDENGASMLGAHGVAAGIVSKLPLQLARIALILHCMTHPDEPTRTPVADETMADAIEIVEYYRANAQAIVPAFGAMPATGSAGLMDRIERFLIEQRVTGWTGRTAIRDHLGRNVSSDDITSALVELKSEGRTDTRIRPSDGGKGGRPSEEWRAITGDNEKHPTRKRENAETPLVPSGSAPDDGDAETDAETYAETPTPDEGDAEPPACPSCRRTLGLDELPCKACKDEWQCRACRSKERRYRPQHGDYVCAGERCGVNVPRPRVSEVTA